MARANFPDVPKGFVYDALLAKNLYGYNQFIRFGREKKLRKSELGNLTINFRKYNKLAPVITPLTEGTPPTATTFSSIAVACSLKQYGNYTVLTDLDRTDPVDVKKDAVKEMGKNAGESLNLITRSILDANTNVLLANGASSVSNITTAVSAEDLLNVIRALERSNVEKVTEYVEGNKNFNTTAIDASYVAIVHPDVAKDIRKLDDFIPVANYPGKSVIMVGEIGSFKNIRFVVDQAARVEDSAGGDPSINNLMSGDGSHADIYTTYIFGADAYARVSPVNESLQTIIKENGGTDDPLNQKMTVGWKAVYGSIILYPEKLVLFKSGATK